MKISADSTCRAAWSSLLQVDSSSLPDLLTRLAQVAALPSEVVESIKRDFPRQYARDDHRHFYNNFDKAFRSSDLNGPWQTFIKFIDQPTMIYLSLASDLLEAKNTASRMSDEELLSLRDEIDALITTTIDSNWPDEVKKFIVIKLRDIREAIENYFITGALPILDAIASTFGHACLREDYRETLKTQEGRGFAANLAKIANIVTVASGVTELAGASAFLLEFFGD
ncbi:hypothetical protein [Stenotrophomonas lactitubi]|uniref:hypothetical protein n=1 Tax=Stenotrophomonas lactitubi TaxID=2045214 RepID=UPI00333F2B8F